MAYKGGEQSCTNQIQEDRGIPTGYNQKASPEHLKFLPDFTEALSLSYYTLPHTFSTCKNSAVRTTGSEGWCKLCILQQTQEGRKDVAPREPGWMCVTCSRIMMKSASGDPTAKKCSTYSPKKQDEQNGTDGEYDNSVTYSEPQFLVFL